MCISRLRNYSYHITYYITFQYIYKLYIDIITTKVNYPISD